MQPALQVWAPGSPLERPLQLVPGRPSFAAASSHRRITSMRRRYPGATRLAGHFIWSMASFGIFKVYDTPLSVDGEDVP